MQIGNQISRSQVSLFPWIKVLKKNLLTSFPEIEVETLVALNRNISEEFERLYEKPKKPRVRKFYRVLRKLYLHFYWKIKWNEECHLKSTCVQIFYYMCYVGLILSKGDVFSEWFSQILTVLKCLPGDPFITCDALLLMRNVKKKYSQAYSEILKSLLFDASMSKPPNSECFVKVMLLFRRLKFLSEGAMAKSEIAFYVSKIRCPADVESWLSSLNIKGLRNIKCHNVTQKFLKKNLNCDAFQKLLEVLFANKYDEKLINSCRFPAAKMQHNIIGNKQVKKQFDKEHEKEKDKPNAQVNILDVTLSNEVQHKNIFKKIKNIISLLNNTLEESGIDVKQDDYQYINSPVANFNEKSSAYVSSLPESSTAQTRRSKRKFSEYEDKSKTDLDYSTTHKNIFKKVKNIISLLNNTLEESDIDVKQDDYQYINSPVASFNEKNSAYVSSLPENSTAQTIKSKRKLSEYEDKSKTDLDYSLESMMRKIFNKENSELEESNPKHSSFQDVSTSEQSVADKMNELANTENSLKNLLENISEDSKAITSKTLNSKNSIKKLRRQKFKSERFLESSSSTDDEDSKAITSKTLNSKNSTKKLRRRKFKSKRFKSKRFIESSSSTDDMNVSKVETSNLVSPVKDTSILVYSTTRQKKAGEQKNIKFVVDSDSDAFDDQRRLSAECTPERKLDGSLKSKLSSKVKYKRCFILSCSDTSDDQCELHNNSTVSQCYSEHLSSSLQDTSQKNVSQSENNIVNKTYLSRCSSQLLQCPKKVKTKNVVLESTSEGNFDNDNSDCSSKRGSPEIIFHNEVNSEDFIVESVSKDNTDHTEYSFRNSSPKFVLHSESDSSEHQSASKSKLDGYFEKGLVDSNNFASADQNAVHEKSTASQNNSTHLSGSPLKRNSIQIDHKLEFVSENSKIQKCILNKSANSSKEPDNLGLSETDKASSIDQPLSDNNEKTNDFISVNRQHNCVSRESSLESGSDSSENIPFLKMQEKNKSSVYSSVLSQNSAKLNKLSLKSVRKQENQLDLSKTIENSPLSQIISDVNKQSIALTAVKRRQILEPRKTPESTSDLFEDISRVEIQAKQKNSLDFIQHLSKDSLFDSNYLCDESCQAILDSIDPNILTDADHLNSFIDNYLIFSRKYNTLNRNVDTGDHLKSQANTVNKSSQQKSEFISNPLNTDTSDLHKIKENLLNIESRMFCVIPQLDLDKASEEGINSAQNSDSVHNIASLDKTSKLSTQYKGNCKNLDPLICKMDFVEASPASINLSLNSESLLKDFQPAVIYTSEMNCCNPLNDSWAETAFKREGKLVKWSNLNNSSANEKILFLCDVEKKTCNVRILPQHLLSDFLNTFGNVSAKQTQYSNTQSHCLLYCYSSPITVDSNEELSKSNTEISTGTNMGHIYVNGIKLSTASLFPVVNLGKRCDETEAVLNSNVEKELIISSSNEVLAAENHSKVLKIRRCNLNKKNDSTEVKNKSTPQRSYSLRCRSRLNKFYG